MRKNLPRVSLDITHSFNWDRHLLSFVFPLLLQFLPILCPPASWCRTSQQRPDQIPGVNIFANGGNNFTNFQGNWRVTWDMIVAWAPESTKAFTSCPLTFTFSLLQNNTLNIIPGYGISEVTLQLIYSMMTWPKLSGLASIASSMLWSMFFCSISWNENHEWSPLSQVRQHSCKILARLLYLLN